MEVRKCLLSFGAQLSFFSSSLSRNVKICRTVILPFVVLYGCETWSSILRNERRLRAENRVLRRIFGPKRDEVTGSGKDYIIGSLMIRTAHQILFG